MALGKLFKSLLGGGASPAPAADPRLTGAPLGRPQS